METVRNHKKENKNAAVKDKIRDYLAETWDSLIQDIDSLDPKERVDRRMRLLEYVMPKAAAQKGEDRQGMSIAQILLGREAVFKQDRAGDGAPGDDI